MAHLIREYVFPVLEANADYLAEIRHDAAGDDMGDAFKKVWDLFQIRFSIEGDETLADEMVTEVNQFNRADVARVLASVMAVEPGFTEKGIAERMAIFKRATGAYIKSLPRKMADEAEGEVIEGFKIGSTVSTIKKALESRFGIATRRAAFIARDQVAKLNGVLNEDRQTDVGIEKYKWRTVRDERVRGNPDGLYPDAIPSHYAREGKTFAWNNPPEGGHPGTEPNCRCYPEPEINF